jgi:hypothetical protein
MEEANLQAIALEIHQVDLRILPILVAQAGLVLAVPRALQVEVQADPQAAVAQEDPEEGGINSPFFLDNLSENTNNFVTNPNNPFLHEVTNILYLP